MNCLNRDASAIGVIELQINVWSAEVLNEHDTNANISLHILDGVSANFEQEEPKKLKVNLFRSAFALLQSAQYYLFEHQVQAMLQLQGCVRIVELAKHYSLRRNERAEQLDDRIRVERILVCLK